MEQYSQRNSDEEVASGTAYIARNCRGLRGEFSLDIRQQGGHVGDMFTLRLIAASPTLCTVVLYI